MNKQVIKSLLWGVNGALTSLIIISIFQPISVKLMCSLILTFILICMIVYLLDYKK
jgi:hypothetical protein